MLLFPLLAADVGALNIPQMLVLLAEVVAAAIMRPLLKVLLLEALPTHTAVP